MAEKAAAKFSRANKGDLVKILKPVEGEVRKDLRQWADDVLGRSQNVDRAAAQVVINACNLLEELDKEV